MWCLRAGEAVALLFQLLWGTVEMAGIYHDFGALPELKPVPCLYHQTTQHGLEGSSHISRAVVGAEICPLRNWMTEAILRKYKIARLHSSHTLVNTY